MERNVSGKEDDQMDLPPGFRFHPTDEELISHYLHKKVIGMNFSARAIGEVDLNKSEPWELPCKFLRNIIYFFHGIYVFFLKIFFSVVWMKGKQKWVRKNGTFSV